ncbi:GIY-YIG nuclease family protein [Roseivirga echinicomitans]|uniref:GIY-YIG nuclease family protein n=1 Tax=Roseivirga echinicomitans TaxID=296218 RepID=UPI000A04DA73|nr:GIY-YIG nuclease family protein [Roseivirga echinicomitans]
MYYVYIIYFQSRDKYYIGSCDHLERRLDDHNSGRSTYTKTGKPWVLKYSETIESRSMARVREAEIKKKKSRKYIEYLISSAS